MTATARKGMTEIDDLDDDERAALKLLGQKSRYAGQSLCLRCTKRYVADLDEVCTVCRDELDESERASKRLWWRNRGTDARTPREAARVWLATELRRGPVDGRTIRRKARERDIAIRTLRRAATDLEVEYVREGAGTDHRCLWKLP